MTSKIPGGTMRRAPKVDQPEQFRFHLIMAPIFKSKKLENAELEVIREIGEMYKSLQYMLSTPVRWSGVLRKNTFARAIQGSNSIEGYVVTKNMARY
jgi:hypothetical protein